MKGIKYFMVKAIIIGVAVVLFLILILTSNFRIKETSKSINWKSRN